MDAEHERAEASAPAPLTLGVAADHELLPAVCLDLQPVAAAAPRLVARDGALRHHALEPLLPRRLEQGFPVLEGAGELDDGVSYQQLLEPRPPLGQREVDHHLAVGFEQVEDLVREMRAPLLHRREARLPLCVERDDLAVDDRVRRPQCLRQLLRDRREPLGQVVAVARHELRLAPAHIAQRAVAVPLRLEQPAFSSRQVLGESREHRPVGAPRGGGHGSVAALAEDEPVLLVAREPRRHECPGSLEPLPMQPHGQPALALLLEQLIRAAIPDFDGPRAVVPLRDLTLDAPVLERMILDVHCEMLLAGLERNALRHRPRGEDAVALEAEVVVQPPRVVSLNDENRLLRLAAFTGEGFGSLLLVALALVFIQLLRHPFIGLESYSYRSHNSYTAALSLL